MQVLETSNLAAHFLSKDFAFPLLEKSNLVAASFTLFALSTFSLYPLWQ